MATCTTSISCCDMVRATNLLMMSPATIPPHDVVRLMCLDAAADRVRIHIVIICF